MTTPVVTLPTVGGATIDIRGTGLGLTASTVSVMYTGGSDGMARRSYTLPPGACTLVSPGTALRYVHSDTVKQWRSIAIVSRRCGKQSLAVDSASSR